MNPTFERWAVAFFVTFLVAPLIPMTGAEAYKFIARGFSMRSLERSMEILPDLWAISELFGIVPSVVATLIFSAVSARAFPILRRMWFPVWMALGGVIGGIIGGAWLILIFGLSADSEKIPQELLIVTGTGGVSGAGAALIFKWILFARLPRWRRDSK